MYSKIEDLFASQLQELLTSQLQELLTSQLQELLRTSCIELYKTKNKLRNLIKLSDTPLAKYAVSIINLLSFKSKQALKSDASLQV